MQEPLNYENDCERLVGYIIYHDSWPVIEDQTMETTPYHVNRMWKREFHCDLDTDHLYKYHP